MGVTSAMQEWPPDVVKFLRTMLGEPTTSETSRWLNAVLTRFWLELRVSALYKERMTRKLVSKLRRKLDTAFVVGRRAHAGPPAMGADVADRHTVLVPRAPPNGNDPARH